MNNDVEVRVTLTNEDGTILHEQIVRIVDLRKAPTQAEIIFALKLHEMMVKEEWDPVHG